MNRIGELKETTQSERLVTLQPGVTFTELEKHLKPKGLFIPSAPTYTDATVGGAVNTDAGGARGYKYGKTREYVQGVKLMLASGEVLEIERGKHIAHPADNKHASPYFELETVNREIRTIPVPTYTMPDVPKISAGYNNKVQAGQSGVDLLDLVVGSEGTLGVITEITLKVREEPPTAMLLVSCASDAQAIKLNALLRQQEPEKRDTREPGGISAVEVMGENAVRLIREKTIDPKNPPPDTATSLLLVQVEVRDESQASLMKVYETCLELGIPDSHILAAIPGETAYEKDKQHFIAVRESIPQTVNHLVKIEGSTKVGADPCVKPERLPELVRIFDDEFGKKGINYYFWGHGEGNFHCNAIPTQEQLKTARESALHTGERAISELKGSGMAEHGVGKNGQKQQLLKLMYRETGINEMREVKRAFDPQGKMAPGNIFPLAA